MRIRAEVRRNVPCRAISNREIDGLLRRAAGELEGGRDMEVSLVLTDDDEMRKVNKKWRSCDEATDVLSFSLAPDMGEILISCDRAREQAREYGSTAKDEAKRLILHGLMHLLGYKHSQMKKIEKKIPYV